MRVEKVLAVLTVAVIMLTPGPSWSAGPPPHGGTVFVGAANAREDDHTSTQLSVNAATTALGNKGFVFLDDPGHAAYAAEVVVNRTDVGMGQEKVPAGRASMMGAGVTVPFSTGQSRVVPLVRTEVEITIRRRGDSAALWHGSAVTVRSLGSRGGADDTVLSVLTTAALAIYPREATEPVGVP